MIMTTNANESMVLNHIFESRRYPSVVSDGAWSWMVQLFAEMYFLLKIIDKGHSDWSS